MSTTRIVRSLHALMAIVFMGIIIAAFYQEFSKKEPPCPLCYLQRLGMIAVSLGNLMHLRFGIHIVYYAFSLLSACFGAAVAMQQICLHICPGFPSFGYPVFTLNLYTWSFLSFSCAILALILLLFFYKESSLEPPPFTWLEKLAFISVGIVIACNLATSFPHCKLSFCSHLL